MNAVRVREFVPADADAVIELVRELQSHEAAIFDRMKPASEISQWYLDGLLEETAKHSGELLVADAGGAVAGYASFLANCQDSYSDEVPYSYAHVNDLVVGRAYRRHGIGEVLVAACEHRARAAGQKWLRLNVLAGNGGARAFYGACGFKEHLLTLEKVLA